ncbi:MAG: 6-phospho 3-hexuloisomerase [Hadesarchaea archaeon DG-33-1]|nr:MAG: 6-phospho 3-hexuloisomerase [Hadesarchaea archaeon DG-33-1]
MREIQHAMREIAEQVLDVSGALDKKQVGSFIQSLLDAKRIFVIGAGRSGLVARAFAMRMMHLGIDTHVVGETTTPSLRGDDLFVAVSGSGETSLTASAAKVAKKIGAKIVAVTSYPKSSLAKISDHVVILPGRTKTESTPDFLRRELLGEHPSFAPLGTTFEVAALVFFDGVIASLMAILGKNEEDLRARHATIE